MVAVIHLDTHVLVWVATGDHDRLPETLVRRLPEIPCRISPMAVLELEYLHEVGRIRVPASTLLEALTRRLELRVAEESFAQAAAKARTLNWTRDPFDRLIAGHAVADDLPLLTADRRMLEHCPVAVWEAWR